jgi:DNA polymerase type B, organellar and viral
MSSRLVDVPTAEADARARRQEQLRRARASYDSRTARSNHGGKNRVKQRDKEFIGWDGEGPKDAGYALFGNSSGDEICHPFLSTRECLDLVLYREQCNPDSIHVWYGSNYDVSMILKDVSWKQFSALKHWNRTVWHEYELQHIPGKWFEVKAFGVTAKLFDICSFFGGTYVSALEAMKIGTPEEIEILVREKARRSEFVYAEIDEIRRYWQLELRLMPELCNKLRNCFLDAGFDVRSWHGPGALANMAMRKHEVFKAKAISPREVKDAAQRAFAAGRFELFRGGHIQRKIYNPDIHSAYPYFATMLPNLAKGSWRRGKSYEPGKFAVYHIRYKTRAQRMFPFPLFHRVSGGEVIWDNNVDGWYWSPEAELVKDDPAATFTESYVFDEDNPSDRPFAWIAEYFKIRQEYQSAGSVMQLTFKLIINAIYGQLAQRAGWDKKKRTAPPSHQLEWAGYITSACRAAVWKAARTCGDGLISIDTDGLYSMTPSDVPTGDDLGQWEMKEYDSGIFWQSGVYALRKNLGYDDNLGYGWVKGRTRGIPKGRYEPQDLVTALARGEDLTLTRKVFTGYGLALNGQRDRLNTWSTEPVELVFGGAGKRYHNKVQCSGRCRNGVHEFIPRPIRWNPADSVVSVPHSLPWDVTDGVADSRKRLTGDYTMFDANHLDYDEQWVTQYLEGEIIT